MNETRIIFCSDVHLCHLSWYGPTSEQRMERMTAELNCYYNGKPYEKIVFLGDYSLDHWQWQVKGSWLERGVSDTARFIKDYASRLKVPYFMSPGNHEQYGNEKWNEIVGNNREDCFTVGGYLIICCDNFAGVLDPDYHSDGIYSPTRLDFVKKAMEEHPGLPVILCAHYFDVRKEPEEFFEFIKNEKRIVFLICGHDHLAEITDLGEAADHVSLFHDGHYSYVGGKRSPIDTIWGFCDAVLTDVGVDIRYVEPACEITVDGVSHSHEYREQHHRFFKRRDIQ